MGRGCWTLLGVVVIAAGLWLAFQHGSGIEKEMVEIVEMTDAAARSNAALNFVLDHPDLDQNALWEMLGTALDSAVEAHGEERAIAIGESLVGLDLPPNHRQEVLSYLGFRHMQSEDPEDLVRGEAILIELLAMDDVSAQTFALSTWLQGTHAESDKSLALKAAQRTYEAAREDGSLPYVMYPIDIGFRSFIEDVAERRGFDEALAAADSLAGASDDDVLRGLALTQLYRLAVDDAPDRASDAVHMLAELEGFEAPDILNEVAYDMAERRFEADIALVLSERALLHAPSRRDSVNILDTAGWAAFAAGRAELAVDYLEQAVDMTNETLSLDVVQVDHLVEAYSMAGDMDGAIALLAKIVARSPLSDDPARVLLEARLVERDGNADALEEMVDALRYDGIDEAPLFTLRDRSGETVALEDLRGSVVLVAFWGYG